MKRLVPTLVLAGALAALLGLSAVTLHALHTPLDPARARRRAAERVIGYLVSPGRGPRFRLTGAEHVIKLVSYAVWPALPYDPERELAYGLTVTLSDNGRTLWQRQIAERTRQSKEVAASGQVERQSVFAAEPGIELGDQRITTIALPPAPAGTILSVSPSGQARHAVVRLFSRLERPPAQRVLVARRLTPVQASAVAGSITFTPWSLMDTSERMDLLRYRYEHLSAVGERGIDYDTLALFVSSFRLPPPRRGAAAGFAVSPGRRVAINVRGPGRVHVEAAPAPGHDMGGVLAIESVADGAAPAMARVSLAVSPADAHGALRPTGRDVALPAGIRSLVLTSTAPLAVTITGPARAALTSRPALTPTGGALLQPDWVIIPVAVTRPGGSPAVIDLTAGAAAPGLEGRALRIDSRAVVDGDDVAAACTVELTFRDRAGRALSRHRYSVAGPVSRFEELYSGDGVAAPADLGVDRAADRVAAPTDDLDADRAADCPGGPPDADQGRWVSEPLGIRLLAPRGTAHLEVRSDRPCAHRFYRYHPGRTRIEEPYAGAPLTTTRFRYPRLVARVWFPLRARNLDVLAAAGQTALMSAQVRLEPRGTGEGAGGATGPVSSLVPEGAVERQLVREPVADAEVPQVIATWPVGSVASLAPGTHRIRFPADLPAHPRLYYHAAGAALGAPVTLSLDRAPWAARTLPSGAGYLTLPRALPGVHEIALAAPAGAHLWLDRPPAGGAGQVARLRSVYALGEHPVTVRVHKRADERVIVDLVVYAPDPAPGGATLHITVGGGHPQRRRGAFAHISTGDYTVRLPPANRSAAAVLVNMDEQPAGYPRVIPVALLEDLVAGTHDIDVRSVGGAHLWVRFFIHRAGRPRNAGVVQWRFDTVGTEGDDAP